MRLLPSSLCSCSFFFLFKKSVIALVCYFYGWSFRHKGFVRAGRVPCITGSVVQERAWNQRPALHTVQHQHSHFSLSMSMASDSLLKLPIKTYTHRGIIEKVKIQVQLITVFLFKEISLINYYA